MHGPQVHRRAPSHAPSDQRLDIFQFNAKDRDVIGRGHRVSLTASYLRRNQSPSGSQPSPGGAILRCMKVEQIAEAIAKLPPDQLARFRRWFTAFEAGRADHAEELDSTATKLGRFAGRAFAELKKRGKEP
jgi:hypothetical protein